VFTVIETIRAAYRRDPVLYGIRLLVLPDTGEWHLFTPLFVAAPDE
jgi:hypothetical protein